MPSASDGAIIRRDTIRDKLAAKNDVGATTLLIAFVRLLGQDCGNLGPQLELDTPPRRKIKTRHTPRRQAAHCDQQHASELSVVES